MSHIIHKKESYAIIGACFGHYPGLEYERLAKTQRVKTGEEDSPMYLCHYSRPFA